MARNDHRNEPEILLALHDDDAPRWVPLSPSTRLAGPAGRLEGVLVRIGEDTLLLEPRQAVWLHGEEELMERASRQLAEWAAAGKTAPTRQRPRSPWRRFRNLARRVARWLVPETPERSPLTDPDTGLPNRLHADIVLGHFVGAARRGESLSVVLISPNGWDNGSAEEPSVRHESNGSGNGNADGNGNGGRLREIAMGLRETTRAADLVARYDPDTFLLALPHCSPSGARHALRRLRGRLTTPFVAGMEEFGPETPTVERLVRAANVSLDRARRVTGTD